MCIWKISLKKETQKLELYAVIFFKADLVSDMFSIIKFLVYSNSADSKNAWYFGSNEIIFSVGSIKLFYQKYMLTALTKTSTIL